MVAAWVAVAVLGCLAVFQLLLVAGAPLGRFAWGGQHAVLPTGLRIGSVVSLAIYAVVALLVLQAAGVLDVLPEGMVGVAMWVLTGYFVLGVALNLASRSRPERMVMTPVALVLAICCLVLALH
ncbi:hypothetical protein [Blastococcus haudaquaticus]|uniref:Uncharacterized protein n=1 Tax=Blastococcus haudaquaticus TaxID=1938745 RepID=A0A286H0U4_9ACTN|nr:hypothetical protein [Blastococcus haudaquaticus]SOE00969.1 hypothetical protein SAMN06272739_2890 [Blastococcus haudaquaticus]